MGVVAVTLLLLVGAWYELSGGTDFEPGDHGVTLLAEVKPKAPQREPVLSSSQARDVAPVKPTRQEPRVTSLRDRDPLPSKTVRAPEPEATTTRAETRRDAALDPERLDGAVAAVEEVLRAESAPAGTPEPVIVSPAVLDPAERPEEVDEIAQALSDAILEDEALVATPVDEAEAAQPAALIAGLGDGLPLGARIDEAAAVAVSDRPDLRMITGTQVNLRGGPATSYPAVAQLFGGAEVELLDDTGDGWVKLRVLESDEIGWMSDDFLSAPY